MLINFCFPNYKSGDFLPTPILTSCVRAEVKFMPVQFINVESFYFLRKFIGPKNPLLNAQIAYFVFLRRSAKNMAARNYY